MNDLKLGVVVIWDKQPYIVQYTQHVQMGRGEPVVRTKLKNVSTGKVLERTFKSGDQLEEADINYKNAQFLYKETDYYHFMDSETYEQFALKQEQTGNAGKFMKEGDEIEIMYFDNQPIAMRLPTKVALKVISAPPAVKGDTAQGSVTKPVTLETGMTLNVPLFIKEGDMIKINTETEEYVERVKT